MSFFPTLVLGILIGWLIEWIIDWIYWRRKNQQQILANDSLLRSNNELQAALARNAQVSDDLKIIVGIGPEIERRLNEAGITTFEKLGQLTPQDLENILGSMIKRLSNEESLLNQARELAAKK